MRVCLSFLLAVLLFVSALPANAFETATAATFDSRGVELAYDEGMAGPLRNPFPNRDEGPDWISYDNGAQGLINGASYWSKVSFTPVSRFQLQMIYFTPLNQYDNFDDPLTLRVYLEDQNNDLDGEPLFEYVIDRVPTWDINAWIEVELDEDDYLEFEADQNFAIMYNSIGGAYGNNQAGDGWWNIYDGANNFDRSFYFPVDNYDDEPSVDHGDWTMCTGDLLMRANGEYLEEYIDLEVTELYNTSEKWIMLPGAEQTFVADLRNNGGAVEAFVVSYIVQNLDGDELWSNQVVVEGLEEEGEISVEAEDTWTAPDEVGNYVVWCFVEAENDANDENNQGGLDQIVIDPENAPDFWIGYIDGTIESTTAWNEESGWASVVWHPGGNDQALALDAFRVLVTTIPADVGEVELDFQVMTLDLEANPPLFLAWEGTATTTGEGEDVGNGTILEWVTVVPEYEDEVGIFDGQAFLISYLYNDGTRFPSDDNPPFAGTNNVMPYAHMTTANDGGSYGPAGSGDYPIQAQMSWSDILPVGPHMRIEPEFLEFGYDLELNQEYVIDAMIISYGDETVEVSQIRLAPSATDYITISPVENIVIPSLDTAFVTLTFLSDEDIELENRILVSNNTNVGQYIWNFHASTSPAPAAMEIAPAAVDFGYELSLDEDYVQTVSIASTGSNDLIISGVTIPEEYAGVFTVEPAEEFTIAPDESANLTITFNTSQKIEIETTFIIHSNAGGDEEFELPVRASNYENSVRENARPGIPSQIELGQNHPNPFNPVTTVNFALTKSGQVQFDVFDMSGRAVKEVFSGVLPAGYHTVEIDASDLPAGVYMYRMVSDGFASTKKMVLMK